MQQQQFSNQQGAAQIDVKTKQNLYASQIMGAAAASGDPQRIQMAKQALAQSNIDPSSWSDDPSQVKLQATALQQSLMSPLGMLNAGIQQQKANAETAQANGTIAPPNVGIGSGGQAAPPLNAPVKPNGDQGTPLPQSAPAADVAVFKQAAAGQPPSLGAPVADNGQPAPVKSPQQMLADAQSAALERAKARVGTPPDTTNMPTLKAQDANTAYQNNIDKAMQNDPQYQMESDTAKGLGSEIAKQTGASAQSDQMNAKLQANIDGLRKLNPDVPDSAWMSPENKVGFEKRMPFLFGDASKDATALSQWENLTHSLTLNGLAQLVSQSAAGSSIRSNKTIVELLKTGTSIPADLPREARASVINDIEAELNNSSTASSNVKNNLTGQKMQPMTSIPVTVQGAATEPFPGFSSLSPQEQQRALHLMGKK